jgi:hypothetical protein
MMKLIKRTNILLLVVGLMLLSFTENMNSYQLECVSLDNEGYVVVKIWDYKRGKVYKLEQASKDAIHAILYAGLAGSNGCISQPPLLSKSEWISNFKRVEKRFFSKKGIWIKFTRSSPVESSNSINPAHKNIKTYQVTIAKGELRKHLEEQNIINSLSNGF